MIQRVRGTEDILDLTLFNFALKNIRSHLACYNFIEIQTPILEYTDLFTRSLGVETDVVTKEMYTFTTKEDGKSICLRPEQTASTMRAFLTSSDKRTPWKVFSHGPMFRHERPQKGRWREFAQTNIEIIGSKSIAQDAHTIKMLDSLFSNIFKLENYVLKINFLGTSTDRKKHKEKLVTFLTKNEKTLCSTCTTRKEKNILRIFDCKNKECKKLYATAPKITDVLSKESQDEWKELTDMLNATSTNFVHDQTLVRGLDYYNKTVFEFSSPELGSQDAFCGGGRYDSLASQLGSKQDYPSIGAAIGMGRLLLLLEKSIDKLSLPTPPTLNLILPMSEDQHPLALLIAHELQSKNTCCDILFNGGSMTSMMRKANKLGAKHVLIIGEDEQKQGTVTVKNMQTGKSSTVKQVDISAILG